jgi:biotin carboxyl carrier protein
VRHRIRIDGAEVAPASPDSLVEAEPGVCSVLAGGKSYEVRIESGHVTVDGRKFAYDVEDPRQWKRSGAGASGQSRAAIVAPMPGKIVRILAAVGDEVEAGGGIVVVEAMKMQNEMKSPVSGRVAEIHAKENDSVVAGAVLAVIDSSGTPAG